MMITTDMILSVTFYTFAAVFEQMMKQSKCSTYSHR